LVGSNVQLRMYDGTFSDPGRVETLTNSDRDLSDNLIGKDRLTSASVQVKAKTPTLVLDPVDPHGPSSAGPTAVDSITVTWQSAGSTEYQARIFSGLLASSNKCGGSAPMIERNPVWALSPSWSFGTLPAGTYTWCVRGRIADKKNAQYYSDWVMKRIDIAAASLPASTTQNIPYVYDVESPTSDWTASGLWRRITDPVDANNDLWACNNADSRYGDPTYGGGDLTSPPIQVPAGGAVLRFRYRYETESDLIFWDQRWVQISQNGGRFQNLIQLSEDKMYTWLASPSIDLSAYANSTIRIRFHFSTADRYYNGFQGWLVDDISLTPPTTQACGESASDTIDTAVKLTVGAGLSSQICPAGDIDFYKFTANAGKKYIAEVYAARLDPTSALDTHLTLLDMDKYGNTLIDSNDDLQKDVMTDSRLYFQIPETGEYYLKVKAGNHPTDGGSAYFYILLLSEQTSTTDTDAPSLTMVYPIAQEGVPSGPATFSVLSEDRGSGVKKIEFWWHSPDWNAGKWQLLSEDAYADDGWSAPFDGSNYAEGQSGALMVISYDNEENVNLQVQWNVPIDDTPPVTGLVSLPAITDSTGIQLSWNASDARSRLKRFEIQYQMDGGDWKDWESNIPSDRRSIWYIGLPGHTYGFRMRGVDTAGNPGTYSSTAETTTQTTGTCKVDPFEQGSGDDKAALAVPLKLDAFEAHNYCGVEDADWYAFQAQAGQEFLIWALPDAGSIAGSTLDLYQSDENGWLMQVSSPEISSPLSVRWVAPQAGLYLIRLTPMTDGVSGNNTGYRIRVGTGWWSLFPIVGK
jgi:hypothetical protein